MQLGAFALGPLKADNDAGQNSSVPHQYTVPYLVQGEVWELCDLWPRNSSPGFLPSARFHHGSPGSELHHKAVLAFIPGRPSGEVLLPHLLPEVGGRVAETGYHSSSDSVCGYWPGGRAPRALLDTESHCGGSGTMF